MRVTPRRSYATLGLLLVALLAVCSCSTSATSESAPTSGPSISTEPGAAASTGCADPDDAFARVGEDGTFTSDGEKRLFSLEVPPDAVADQPLPLVVNMHGALGSRTQQEASSHFAKLGRQEGFIVLAPQARGDRPIWSLVPSGVDVAYVERLIDEALAKLCIDTNRVYLTGFSMGGMMSMVLACRDPGRFAAVAPVAGAIDVANCERDEPVPLITMHGTDDNSVKFDGTFDPNVGLLVGANSGPSREEVVETWAVANGCDAPADEMRLEPDVERIAYACASDEAVEMYVIDDGGHTWPGSQPNPIAEALAGRTTQTINATQLIWEFFQRHTRSD